MLTITVPQGLRTPSVYVAGSLLSTVFLLTWQTIQVSKHRKLAGIPYPRQKAEMDASPAAAKFDSVQRAHANTLENIPTVYLMTILVGIQAPVVAASALGAWVLSRIVYTNRDFAPSASSALRPSMDMNQWLFCSATIRKLKEQNFAYPFLRPVDPVMLCLPQYPIIVRNPMDLSTMERKLKSSNPENLESNPDHPRYLTVDEYVADVRLIVNNCILFNGPEHQISVMAKHMEEFFDNEMKNMPAVGEEPIVKEVAQ
ncbi:Bromodomain-containing protein [Favolaschia claudopus]|uniref:Bromodomain-containing protein n=1 Tax=Favolaschia claudopus TaxID=2862362 RepID=A0AAW0D0U6_9AGAR